MPVNAFSYGATLSAQLAALVGNIAGNLTLTLIV